MGKIVFFLFLSIKTFHLEYDYVRTTPASVLGIMKLNINIYTRRDSSKWVVYFYRGEKNALRRRDETPYLLTRVTRAKFEILRITLYNIMSPSPLLAAAITRSSIPCTRLRDYVLYLAPRVFGETRVSTEGKNITSLLIIRRLLPVVCLLQNRSLPPPAFYDNMPLCRYNNVIFVLFFFPTSRKRHKYTN